MTYTLISIAFVFGFLAGGRVGFVLAFQGWKIRHKIERRLEELAVQERNAKVWMASVEQMLGRLKAEREIELQRKVSA